MIDDLSDVEGYLSDSDILLLRFLARECSGIGCVVEIGSWKGKSTIALSQGSKNGAHIEIYSVDHHHGSEEHLEKKKKVYTLKDFKKNIEKYEMDDIVIPLVKTSSQAAKNFKKKIELLFIDGDHTYKSVKQDLKLWFPKVIVGGVIALHDNYWDGPRKVIDEYMKDNPTFMSVKEMGSITYGIKLLKKLPIVE